MELALLLYAASIADNLRSGADLFIGPLLAAVLCNSILFAVSCVNLLDCEETDSNSFQRWLGISRISRKLVLASFFGWTALTLVSHLIPERKDVYVMAGGYVALKVARSPVGQSATDSVVSSIEKWLDKAQSSAGTAFTSKPTQEGK